jgi:CDP-diacylglycerol---glycerol-3-phosphate 3-phosphatidyltransferase
MTEELQLYSHPAEKPNFFDKVLGKSLLLLVPKNISPNHVTLFRYASIPFILFFLSVGYNGWGIILFAISTLSDAVDGALARTRNQITDWGKINDPFADKLLISSVGAVVVSIYLSVYIITTIIAIEFLLILNAFFKMKKKFKVMSALWPGKIKMILQSLGITFVLLYVLFPISGFLILATYTLYAAIFFGLLSLVVYGSI